MPTTLARHGSVKRAVLCYLCTAAWVLGTACGEERFVAHTTDVALPAAPLVKMAADWSVELGEPAGAVAAGTLVELHQEGVARPPLPREYFVLLTHGDCIVFQPGAPVRLDEGRLRVTPVEGKSLSLYRPYVVLFFLSMPDGADDPDLFLARLRKEARTKDVVFLKNGDRIEGTVTALGRESGAVVQEEGRRVTVAWDKLAGIAWNTQHPSRPRLRRAIGHAVLEGGARLNFTQLRFDGAARRWLGTTWFGETFELAESRLAAVDLWNGPAVYLSDLAGRYEHTPYLGVGWPLSLDADLAGRPLALADGVYDRGLGMHTASRVTYRLDGQYRWFEAVVGLDAHAGPHGRARLAVLVDGQRHDLGDGKEWRGQDRSLPIRLDVRGARELTLVAEFGRLGGVQGRVNWGNARLIKGD